MIIMNETIIESRNSSCSQGADAINNNNNVSESEDVFLSPAEHTSNAKHRVQSHDANLQNIPLRRTDFPPSKRGQERHSYTQARLRFNSEYSVESDSGSDKSDQGPHRPPPLAYLRSQSLDIDQPEPHPARHRHTRTRPVSQIICETKPLMERIDKLERSFSESNSGGEKGKVVKSVATTVTERTVITDSPGKGKVVETTRTQSVNDDGELTTKTETVTVDGGVTRQTMTTDGKSPTIDFDAKIPVELDHSPPHTLMGAPMSPGRWEEADLTQPEHLSTNGFDAGSPHSQSPPRSIPKPTFQRAYSPTSPSPRYESAHTSSNKPLKLSHTPEAKTIYAKPSFPGSSHSLPRTLSTSTSTTMTTSTTEIRTVTTSTPSTVHSSTSVYTTSSTRAIGGGNTVSKPGTSVKKAGSLDLPIRMTTSVGGRPVYHSRGHSHGGDLDSDTESVRTLDSSTRSLEHRYPPPNLTFKGHVCCIPVSSDVIPPKYNLDGRILPPKTKQYIYHTRHVQPEKGELEHLGRSSDRPRSAQSRRRHQSLDRYDGVHHPVIITADKTTKRSRSVDRTIGPYSSSSTPMAGSPRISPRWDFSRPLEAPADSKIPRIIQGQSRSGSPSGQPRLSPQSKVSDDGKTIIRYRHIRRVIKDGKVISEETIDSDDFGKENKPPALEAPDSHEDAGKGIVEPVIPKEQWSYLRERALTATPATQPSNLLQVPPNQKRRTPSSVSDISQDESEAGKSLMNQSTGQKVIKKLGVPGIMAIGLVAGVLLALLIRLLIFLLFELRAKAEPPAAESA